MRLIACVALASILLFPGHVRAANADAAADPADPETLDAVVVTATRRAADQQDVAASVSVQDKAALDRRGFYAGGDEFRGVPGVFFRRGQGDNEDILTINFRGIIGNHGNDTFLALFDGLSFLSSDDELLMQELPYAAVGRVEIVRGPVSAPLRTDSSRRMSRSATPLKTEARRYTHTASSPTRRAIRPRP